MTSRPAIAVLALLAIVFLPLVAVAETPEKEAIKAAESWLALVDAGDYAKSWDAAAAYFRGAITKEKWEQTLEGVRPPFGNVLSRKVKNTQYATSLPGAPDGEYVVIQFETSFAHKSDAVETVTPMKDEDGKWRVSGYFIR
ncbi:MAG: DUF4019 domain-containing protein [Acidobacteria bacterium]|nr:MAG: DUF4019 domain-containing protein [Acidobacteriota bacterium]